MPTDTRQRLVEAATRRFYRDGFRNVGIDQILADVKISKTAFYKHFECKEDLMLAALKHQENWMRETFRAMVHERSDSPGRNQLRALFDVVEEIIENSEYRGCIFVNVAMEFPLPHEPAHVAAARSKRSMEDMVCEMAAEAGAAQPRELAEELCLIMEGAYVTRHVSGNEGTVRIARRVAEEVIESHLGQRA